MKKFKTVEKFWLGKKYFIRDAENNVLAVLLIVLSCMMGKMGWSDILGRSMTDMVAIIIQDKELLS